MENQELLEKWISWFQIEAQKRGEKFTQLMLAEKAGLKQHYISKLINGNRGLGNIVLSKLCIAFGISKAEFYAGPNAYIKKTPETIFKLRRHDDHTEEEMKKLIIRTASSMKREDLMLVSKLLKRLGYNDEVKSEFGRA